MDPDTRTLGTWLSEANTAVFFGGAGMSTESGIPDFRSSTGLYTTRQGTRFPPEYMLSHTCYERYPEDFFAFYRSAMLHPEARPNPGHEALARLEELGHLSAVVTQNIDGLHQAAGSREVVELHGSVHRNTCQTCGENHDLAAFLELGVPPRCPRDGGIVKPDVVLYEEPLDEDAIERAVEAIAASDVLIVGGTSLNVYPAAGLVQYHSGGRLAVVNMAPTPWDDRADLVISAPLGRVLTDALSVVETLSA